MLQSWFNIIDLISQNFFYFIGGWRQIFPVHHTSAPVAAAAQASVWGGSLLTSWPAHGYERKQDSIWLRRQSVCELHPFRNVLSVWNISICSAAFTSVLMNTIRDWLVLNHLYVSLGPEYVKLVKRVRLGSVQNK